jgi:uncharacterized protein YydD (DUF2326 family)
MKLSKIYSNKKDIFIDIKFNPGFNVILGQIRLPENVNKDSHNLGKSKLAEIIDFCLLKGRNKNQFLFKNIEIFGNFVFYLELELNDNSFITIRRSPENHTKIWIKKHKKRYQDFREISDDLWDYENLTFEKAKLILDTFFDLKALAPWDYRQAINYTIRNQNDFNDIFKLSNHLGSHIDWKPYLGHSLGFEPKNLIKNYELVKEIEDLNDSISNLKIEIGDLKGDDSEILNELLKIKTNEEDSLNNQLNEFNFNQSDIDKVNDISENLDSEISDLNKIRYYLNANISKLENSIIENSAKFKINTTEKLFEEAGILFGDQIKISYKQLEDFNKKITIERNKYIKEQIEELSLELKNTNIILKNLNADKARKLTFLKNVNVFDKFKNITNDIIILKSEINELNRKLEISNKIKSINDELREKRNEKDRIVEEIRKNKDKVIDSDISIYKKIKDEFVTFVKEVLNKNGIITTKQNDEGNLEFIAGIIDDKGKFTSESDGHSYKKILCIGYDIAVIISYKNDSFIRFIYHDGGLETLDERKKIQFLEYVRKVTEENNFQYILTLIDSDLPNNFKFTDDEIALKLHDDGNDGKLFRMQSW